MMNDGNRGRGGTGGAAKPNRTAFDWPHDTGTTSAVLREMAVQVNLRRRRRRILLASGSIAVLLLSAWVWQPGLGPLRVAPAAAAPVVTSTPERRILPDGSIIVLRDDAVVDIDYAERMRRVRLLQGEAIFDVRKDPARPFIVRAARVDVRAVGTEFVVQLQDTAVEVLVTEGEVAVQGSNEEKPAGPQSPSPSRPVTPVQPVPSPAVALATPEYKVPAGKRIVVPLSPTAPPPDVFAMSPEQISRRLGWRVPTLRFSRTPLREAVAMINQHSRIHLVLEGAALNDVPLSGAIRADNIDALLELLAADHGIRAEPRGAGEVVLRQAPALYP